MTTQTYTGPKASVQLAGQDGNTFAIVGRVSDAMRRQGLAAHVADYRRRVMAAKSYDEVLQITLQYADHGTPPKPVDMTDGINHSFGVRSGEIIVSDPCYNMDIVNGGGGAFRIKAKNGEWYAEVEYEGNRQSRVAALRVRHTDHLKAGATTPAPCLVDVDSGQAGVFDFASYKGDDRDRIGSIGSIEDMTFWYARCCKQTLSEESCGTIDDRGFVSSTGYGDGAYECRLVMDGDMCVGVDICFVEEEEEDECFECGHRESDCRCDGDDSDEDLLK